MIPMFARLVSPMPLLLAGLAAGCSGESPPSAPPIAPFSGRELRTTFYWEYNAFAQGRTVRSGVGMVGRAKSRGPWADVGSIRLAGMEVSKNYSQDEGVYSYSGSWDSLLWNDQPEPRRTLLLEVAGTADFPSFTDTIPVTILEPFITSPAPGSSIWTRNTFILRWDGRRKGGMVEVRFFGPDGDVRERSGWVPDTGELIVEPEMIEGMKLGPWRIQIERTEHYQKALPGGGRSIVSSTARYITAVHLYK